MLNTCLFYFVAHVWQTRLLACSGVLSLFLLLLLCACLCLTVCLCLPTFLPALSVWLSLSVYLITFSVSVLALSVSVWLCVWLCLPACLLCVSEYMSVSMLFHKTCYFIPTLTATRLSPITSLSAREPKIHPPKAVYILRISGRKHHIADRPQKILAGKITLVSPSTAVKINTAFL